MWTPAAGLVGGLGLVGAICLLYWGIAARRPVLASRLRGVLSPGLGEPVATYDRLAWQGRRAAWRLLRRFGSDEELSRRLRRAGWRLTADTFRLVLVGAATGGALSSVAVGLLASPAAASHPLLPVVLLAVIGAAVGALVADRLLTRAVAARERRLAAEFPAVADLLAFAVSAGEATVGALGRVVACSSGELAGELGVVLADVRTGTPIATALRRLADRVGVVAIHRFVDGVVVAIERGTPLAEVLRAQAADARAHSQRQLIEAAGRREVFMLMPVVFLILPTVVLVALFPGLQALTMTVP